MAKKGIDFSLQLDDIQAPVAPNGNLLVAAGKSEGVAHEIAAGIETQKKAHQSALAGFLGTQAIEGVKGKLQADEENAINDVLRRLDSNAEADIAANNKRLAGQFLDSAASDDFAGTATVRHFTEEARKFAEARRQGVIGREEAVAQIGSIVKKYSASMPGWASEFRKVAANLTGVSNIDVHGIHAALTQQSLREKAAQKQAEQDAQLRKEAASALGLASVEELTPDYLAFYRQTKQFALRTQNAENMKKNADITQEQADTVNGQIGAGLITQGVSGIAGRFAQLHATHLNSNTPVKHEDALRLGSELAGELDVLHAQLVSRINGLTIGRNGMSREKAAKVIADIRPMFDAWKEAVKTAEGFNLWSQQVKAAKGNVDHIVSTTMMAAPHLAVLRELGVMPDMARAWIGLGGDKEKFTHQFGKDAANAIEAAMKAPQAYADSYRLIATGRGSIRDESARNPNLGRVLYNDVIKRLEDLMEQGQILTPKQKPAVANLTRNWLDTFRPTKTEDLKKFSRLMTSDSAVELLSQLNPMERAEALTPFFDKVRTTIPNTIADVRARVSAVNAAPVNKDWGHRVEIALNPITQQFDLNIRAAESPNTADRIMQPGGPLNMRPFVRFGTDAESREQVDIIKQRLAWLNAVPHVVQRMAPLVNSEARPKRSAMLNQIEVGLKSGRPIHLVGNLFKLQDPAQLTDQNDRRMSRVPRNLEPDVIDMAIVAAEGSDVNPGLSPKGALGRYQLMPGTAKELGLVVDPAKGIDERTDDGKARAAALNYFRKQLDAFDGDISKAAAAYNAGPRNVKEAIQEATKAGAPDDWQLYLPKPKETVPYIRRFLNAAGR